MNQMVTKRIETNEQRVIIRLNEMDPSGFRPSIDRALASVRYRCRFRGCHETDTFATLLTAELPRALYPPDQ
jgi:hypothetical protein